MRKPHVLFFLVFCSMLLFFSQHARADIEWTLKKQLKLEAAPLDIASSMDGKWLFVLNPGEIAVYSVPEYKLVKNIPVDKRFDRLAYSLANNTLIVSSSVEKAVKIIQLEVIHHFALQGVPFKGPKNAPVTLVVFSDYQ